MLADNRIHPRVQTELAVEIGIPGDRTGAKIIDMSLGGVTIRGSHVLAHMMMPELETPVSVGREFVISFSLPFSEFSEVCRLVHVRRLSQSDFEFGMKFIELSPRDLASISDYINNHVRG